MRIRFVLQYLTLVFILSGCSEKVIIDGFSMKRAVINAPHTMKLSDFLGEHRLVTLEDHDSLKISPFPDVIKRDGFFYVISKGRCHRYDQEGKFLNFLDFTYLSENEKNNFLGYDIVLNSPDNPEWWLGIYDGNYKIIRISISSGEIIETIHVDAPFLSFKYINNDMIFITLKHQQYIAAICNSRGDIIKYGLKKKTKSAIDNYFILRDEDDFLVQYQMSSLAVSCNKKTGKMSEVLLIEDDGFVNTYQREAQYIEKNGEIRGVNMSAQMHNTICYYSKQNSISTLYFNNKKSLYLSINRGKKEYKTVRVEPYRDCSLINDLPIEINQEELCKYLTFSFQGKTDSDNSVLLYILQRQGITEHGDMSVYKKRSLILIDVFDKV